MNNTAQINGGGITLKSIKNIYQANTNIIHNNGKIGGGLFYD